MQFDFKTITIIGVGLIGGSVACALKKKYNNIEIIGVGKTKENLEKAKSQGIIDSYFLNPEEAVANSDLIIIATPVLLIPKVFSRIEPFVKPGVIVTDVGSSKLFIVETIEKIGSTKIKFIGSHPMAGSEKKGIDFAKPDLFINSICFVTKDKNTDKYALNKIENFWNDLGAKVIEISSDEHDSIVALTSHIPHILAFLLSNMALDEEKFKNKLQIRTGIANGFKDTTRIASSDPIMWRDICLSNKKHILKRLNDLRLNLFKMETLIQMEDKEGLLSLFQEAKKYRDSL